MIRRMKKNAPAGWPMVLIMMALITLFPAAAGATTCGQGVGVPPFLETGADSNLLMIIDNSASMYDLAYVDSLDPGSCYDGTDMATGTESFDSSAPHAGYFKLSNQTTGATQYYSYDQASGQFVEKSQSDALSYCNGALGLQYKKTFTNPTDGSVTTDVCIAVDTFAIPNVVTAFVATGNFLNWAAASKFDIEKQILTGGKYDAATQQLSMESRGCLNRRFVKQVKVSDAFGMTYYLALGVYPPKEQEFPKWQKSTSYSVGDIVTDVGNVYIATVSGISGGIGVENDNTDATITVQWTLYKLSRWYNGVTYPPGSIVYYYAGTNLSAEGGRMYYTELGGTSSGPTTGLTGPEYDTGVDWVLYTTTQIEVFPLSTKGFDQTPCDTAVTLMQTGDTQGQIKQNIDQCMGYSATTAANNNNAAFNHAIYNCWYIAKQGAWPPGAGPVESIRPTCEKIYSSGVNPWDITPDMQGYVCYGLYSASSTGVTQLGYVGRCWKVVTAGDPVCVKYHPQHIGDDNYCQQWDFSGSTVSSSGWLPDDSSTVVNETDACISAALKDFCVGIEVPEVSDPSDQVGETDQFWNLPAMLTEYGVLSQLGEPIFTMNGVISQPDLRIGLIQEYAPELRMGVMVFNNEGSRSECAQTDPYVIYNCTNPNNKDGGTVISYIDKSDAHTTAMVNAINDVKATSWTPLAEAMFNGLGYYTQYSTRRLQTDDFLMDATHPDPIIEYCQRNNILFITDGASTTDSNPMVSDFVAAAGQNDGDTGDVPASAFDLSDCGTLDGSTLLDDLTWYGRNGVGIYANEPFVDEFGNPTYKENIATHIVVAGTPRNDGTGECNPDTLLTNAATNGGTELKMATNITELEEKLREAFSAIRAGASAGSAASVISTARGGQGAVYQAIFWPKIDNPANSLLPDVDWVGEVHGLFMDKYGYMYEDTPNPSPNFSLDSGDKRVIIYFDETLRVTKACYDGIIDASGTCTGTIKDLKEVNYLWSANEWLAKISHPNVGGTLSSDIQENRAQIDNADRKRLVKTWNDLDMDGIVDDNEVIDFVPSTVSGVSWAGMPISGGRAPVPQDFGVDETLTAAEQDAEVDKIVRWIRGEDLPGLRQRQTVIDLDVDGMAGKEKDVQVTWRLGDVVHSTPLVVAAPSEKHELYYNDYDYKLFKQQHKNRRQVVYYGANDGMFHAANAGFFRDGKFCRSKDCTTETSQPELGAELWAYVPYNAVPHLSCLTKVGYEHKYYVDLAPRVFDAQIFANKATTDPLNYPGGWGTVLVGGMRFGGGTVPASSLATLSYPGDNRVFVSAYFIFDVTIPEQPRLLAELTRTTGAEADLGYSIVFPGAVSMRDGSNIHWYLLLANGPQNLKGESFQNAKLAVFPLDKLGESGAAKGAFRIPNTLPGGDQSGVFNLTGSPNGFITDIETVDYNILNKSALAYNTDAVYFGTVEGSHMTSWTGKMYRLVTHDFATFSQAQRITTPSEWAGLGAAMTGGTNPGVFLNVNRPITGGVNVAPSVMAGKYSDPKTKIYDASWVAFGTGRFFASEDRVASTVPEAFFAVKEPVDCATDWYTWKEVQLNTTGTHGLQGGVPGSRGVLDVSDILVGALFSRTSYKTAPVTCKDGTTGCLPCVDGIYPSCLSPVTNFGELHQFIAGTGCNTSTVPYYNGADGWMRKFSEPRERNVGRGLILGGMATWTTYQPFNSVCIPEGLSYLYAPFLETGTAWPVPVFGINYVTGGSADDKMMVGRGLAAQPNLHLGADGASIILQTSTGEIAQIEQPNLAVDEVTNQTIFWEEVK